MFTGLTLERFLERMERYGFVQDKTCLLEGTMLRLKLIRQQKPKKQLLEETRPSGARTQHPATASKPNRTARKDEPAYQPIINSAGLSANDMA